MELSFSSISRLLMFMQQLQSDVYPEAPTTLHDSVTNEALSHLLQHFPLSPGAAVLDVGCGQGVALDRFCSLGFHVTGINLDLADIQICRDKGHQVLQMDQSFLEFPDESFDLVWARHVIEHSIFPFFTLSGFSRVLKPGGMLYLEVPGGETTFRHELNPNHYSILSHTMWLSLMERVGLPAQDAQKYYLGSEHGPDEYWGFYGRKVR
jgi:2-polyprenyl-3-methyl-5-hydroxy-6-metoxy-1,4-benzoquinol methylase